MSQEETQDQFQAQDAAQEQAARATFGQRVQERAQPVIDRSKQFLGKTKEVADPFVSDERLRTAVLDAGYAGLKGAGVIEEDVDTGDTHINPEGVAIAVEEPYLAAAAGGKEAAKVAPHVLFHLGRVAVGMLMNRGGETPPPAEASVVSPMPADPTEGIPVAYAVNPAAHEFKMAA